MRSSWLTAAAIVAGLALAGAALRPLLRGGSAAAAVTADGGPFGLLGGLRTIAADAVWLRAYLRWEKRDAPATDQLVRLATALDPGAVYFWINGARIVAYDLAVWRILAEGGFARVPAAEQARIEGEQARRGIALLARARERHPRNPALWIEQAAIELNRLHDRAAAAESYRRAAELPGAPYYAARLHAEMLRRIGRKTEALAWLARLHPTLPADDEAAAADVVLERIRTLESELGVPAEEAYRPGQR